MFIILLVKFNLSHYLIVFIFMHLLFFIGFYPFHFLIFINFYEDQFLTYHTFCSLMPKSVWSPLFETLVILRSFLKTRIPPEVNIIQPDFFSNYDVYFQLYFFILFLYKYNILFCLWYHSYFLAKCYQLPPPLPHPDTTMYRFFLIFLIKIFNIIKKWQKAAQP